MSYIFISYSKRNNEYAYELAEFLQRHGFHVWIDKVGIEYGVDWWDTIVDGLRNCAAFLVVMTPEAKISPWVKREVFLALDWKKPVFPLLLDGENWELFVLTQYADVQSGSMPDVELLGRLSQHVAPQRTIGENKSSLTPEKHIPSQPSRFDIDQAIVDFGRAFRARNWSQAQEILGRIRASGQDPTPFNPDDFERKVHAEVEAEARQREEIERAAERDRQYQRVVAMLDYADSATVWTAFRTFWKQYPNYDPEKIADKVRPKPRFPLPVPFEWVDIPAGKVQIEGYGTYVPAFSIAKYPITVAQYEMFFKDGGYEKPFFWLPQGWEWRQKEKIRQPRYWHDKNYKHFFQPDHPMIGISWYEAMAFCTWLSKKAGENILLPTEPQWQRAAQGDDGRLYPWGNQFDYRKCNCSAQNKSSGTTPVTEYLIGTSPYGVMDMCGNVWEWLLTADDSQHLRAQRGGSWWTEKGDFFRVDLSDWLEPTNCLSDLGFRIVRY